jgi:hypothetical protein
MRVTDKETGRALWLADDNIIAIADVEGGTEILFRESVDEVTSYLVVENFETVVNQVDPLLEGDTVEEVIGGLLKQAASTPLSVLRRGGRSLGF